jgi:hypothetical protein
MADKQPYNLINSNAYFTRSVKAFMDTIVEQLDTKLGQWEPEIADQVRQFIWEMIQLADQGIPVELMRSPREPVLQASRAVEQEVLDFLDESDHK